MTFKGWASVAGRLRSIAETSGARLNAGQCGSLRVLAGSLPRHGMVIADEVGMGKTRIAVAVARAVVESGGRVAILIPSQLGSQWLGELRRGGVPDVPDVLRSLRGFLEVWKAGAPGRPWFDERVVLVSHGFTNWRFGVDPPSWRLELLQMLVGQAQKDMLGRYPNGFSAMSDFSDARAWNAAEAIADHCGASRVPEVRRRYEALKEAAAWRAARQVDGYQKGGEPRRLLQSAVGLGLGAFDLLIVDEAHKSRGEDTGLSRLLADSLVTGRVPRHLCMTATPVEFRAEDWDQTLARAGIDAADRLAIGKEAEDYGTAVRRVRLAWRSSPEARRDYVDAAQDFQSAIGPFVLRRDKRQDEAVILYRSQVLAKATAPSLDDKVDAHETDPGGYRQRNPIEVVPSKAWQGAVCAAEALSFVVNGRQDGAAKRLRLTFGNGHGITHMLDASTGTEEVARQAGDLEIEPDRSPRKEQLPLENDFGNQAAVKRTERAAWWRNIIDRVARAPGALYGHPAILAAVGAIEKYDLTREKVLVFGRFTEPMRALASLLNARAMLRALGEGTPWPQSVIPEEDFEAVTAAYRQMHGEKTVPDFAALNERLKTQYDAVTSRRATLRSHLFDLIDAGLPGNEKGALALASAARNGSAEAATILAAAIDQLVDDGTAGREPSAAAVADAFVALVAALRERSDGDANNEVDASALWEKLAERLGIEYSTERGRFARLMNGATELSTRRTLQLAFNRRESNPRILIAQSVVGREGLDLHEACRVVVLLHPEWNPGIVEQQIGRVDRLGSLWARMLEEAFQKDGPLPRIEIRPVIFEGTYDTHHWHVLYERWDDLQAQLHGVVVPHRLRKGCTAEERRHIRDLDEAAPSFRPNPC